MGFTKKNLVGVIQTSNQFWVFIEIKWHILEKYVLDGGGCNLAWSPYPPPLPGPVSLKKKKKEKKKNKKLG